MRWSKSTGEDIEAEEAEEADVDLAVPSALLQRFEEGAVERSRGSLGELALGMLSAGSGETLLLYPFEKPETLMAFERCWSTSSRFVD